MTTSIPKSINFGWKKLGVSKDGIVGSVNILKLAEMIQTGEFEEQYESAEWNDLKVNSNDSIKEFITKLEKSFSTLTEN